MINIFESITTAVVSAILGLIIGIGMLHGTDAPEWAVISLITITSLQAFIYIPSVSTHPEQTNAE